MAPLLLHCFHSLCLPKVVAVEHSIKESKQKRDTGVRMSKGTAEAA